jgi:hypothetical protein
MAWAAAAHWACITGKGYGAVLYIRRIVVTSPCMAFATLHMATLHIHKCFKIAKSNTCIYLAATLG